MKIGQSIRFKFSVLSLGIILMAVVPIGIVVKNIVESSMLDTYVSSANQQLATINGTTALFQETLDNDLRMFATDDVVRQADASITSYAAVQGMKEKMHPSRNGGLEQQIYECFEHYATNHPGILYVYMGTTQGGYIQWPETTNSDNYDPRQRPWYKAAVAADGNVAQTDPYADSVTGLLIVSNAIVIRDEQGKQIGVMALDASSDRITQILNNIKIGQTGYCMMIHKSGLVLADPHNPANNSKYLKDITIPGLERVLESDETRFRLPINGVEYFVNSRRFENSSWVLVSLVQVKEVYASSKAVERVVFWVGLAAIVVSLILALFITTLLTRPVLLARDAIAQIAEGEGNLASSIKVRSRDEIGMMVDGFNQFVAKLRDIVIGLREANSAQSAIGQNFASAAAESASSIHQISKNLESVRTQTQTQMNSVTQVSTAVTEIARNIESLEKLIDRQGNGISHASASVEQMISNIGNVNGNVNHMAEEFELLITESQSGNKLQEIVAEKVGIISGQSTRLMEANSVIAGIAAQTNLLAMNAAIEAAHAGDSGRGFSVVADEIRKLSETTAVQSRDIRQELESIQKSITEVVQSSARSEQAFHAVVSKIQGTGNLVAEVNQAMVEQAQGSQQVLESLQGMTAISSQVQEGAREMTSGNSIILNEIESLKHVSESISGSMEEIALGAGEIASASSQVSTMAEEDRQLIQKIASLIQRFKT